jgi:hypothetical protein
MAMFKGGTGGMLSGMAGNVVVVNYRNGKVVLCSASGERKFTERQKRNWKRFSALTSFWGQFDRSPRKEGGVLTCLSVREIYEKLPYSHPLLLL